MQRFEANADRIEAFLVVLVLAPAVALSGYEPKDLVAAFAVFLSFLCSQAAFTMCESTHRTERTLSRRFRLLYVAKEVCWIATCILIGSYPLLASTFVFATYPSWRRMVRRNQPQPQPPTRFPVDFDANDDSPTEPEHTGFQYLH